jgi:cobyrinic acid a,c-diamide synthase
MPRHRCPRFNLDTWAMPASLLDWLPAETARHCELLVIEGVMGLFDGVPGPRAVAPERRCGSRRPV